ncbi:MAG: hypothetical protein HYZ38_10380 [Mycobacterium sp.]|nr:hypothetical protein [Mycobacterium sp.]
MTATFCAGTLLAGVASADPAPDLAEAVASARGHCGPLTVDPRVDRAADIVNQSTYDYVDHTARDVPADDPHPAAIVKDLGIEGAKTYALQGAALDDADAIRGLLVQGFSVIPDCGYTSIGTSRLYEPESGFHLLVVVLVGP